MTAETRLLRRRDVESRTGLKKSMLYELMQGGQFPRPIPLAGQTVAWPEAEVDAWVRARLEAAGRARLPQ